MSDREGYLKRRDQLLMQDERIAELESLNAALEAEHLHAVTTNTYKKRIAELESLNAALEAELKVHLENLNEQDALIAKLREGLYEVANRLAALLGDRR